MNPGVHPVKAWSKHVKAHSSIRPLGWSVGARLLHLD